MTRRKTAMFAVFSAALCLILCGSMLLNGTFAWFTDNVTNAENIIQSGTLKVGLEYSEDGNTWNDASAGKIFNYQLWEPGYTDVKAVKIENKGTLALTFALALYAEEEAVNGAKLSDVIEVYMSANKITSRTDLNDDNYVGTLAELMDDPDGAAYGVMLPEGSTENVAGAVVGSKTYWIALHMKEEAGNEYQNLTIGDGIAVKLLATQYTHENDDFNNQYDAEAAFPAAGAGKLDNGDSAIEIPVTNEVNSKVGSVIVPSGAIADSSLPVEATYTKSDYQGNFTVDAGMETLVMNVEVTNLKEDNNVPVKAYIRIAAGLDPATVTLYHYDEKVEGAVYNPTTGYVIFESVEFSPFTVVFDAESKYTPPVIEGGDGEEGAPDLPEASVERTPEYENITLDWSGFGGLEPDLTVDADPKLEAVYTFSCLQTQEEAESSPYAYWYCDFYVKLDRDLEANQILLGGNYGDFGWVGFHNGDLTLEANTEIPLLGSMVENGWTYIDVYNFVSTFICGVGDVNDSLKDATFTVMLRLTNPVDETEFYDVATINYTFE